MKTISRMSRLFGALAALLLLSVSSFTLTSCGDDDDDVPMTFTVNGESFTVGNIEINEYMENCYEIYCYCTGEDGVERCLELDISKKNLGKTCDLTKDLTYYDEDGNVIWWTGIYFDCYDGETGEWDWDNDYWTAGNSYESEFKSGTLYANLSKGTATIKASGVTYDDKYTFNINYSGKYESSDKVRGKVKAKVQAKAKAKK